MTTALPHARPVNPRFSSGPCAKHPGWSLQNLENAFLGRSHRARNGKERLKKAIELTREVLEIPKEFKIAIVPASDTGALEMALWSLLGARGVDLLAWESFGQGWVSDVLKQLKLPDARVITAAYGELPDLAGVDCDRDVVFTWNGTTSGVCVPDGDWIGANRAGLTICDATSAAFAQLLPWDKLDATTFSWQKALGGEAAHGMVILSPRALERLETYTPAWPIPKIFRLTKSGKLIEGVFGGETINTPSMLCVEDYIDALQWAKRVGGAPALRARADANAGALNRWVDATPWIANLSKDRATRSNTSVCLSFCGDGVTKLDVEGQAAFSRKVAVLLEGEGVAFDIAAHRDAPPGLRIWCGSTVETTDIEALLPWLEWAYGKASAALSAAA